MNKNVKINNPMKVITGPDTRWSYANVWEPKSINGGTPKYSVSLIIPKSDTKTIAKIEAAIEAAYKEGEAKLKGNGKSVPALSVIKTPLRDGDMERPDDPAYANAYFVNANATSAPGIVDADRNPILTRSEVYSGVYGRASISFYAFNISGNKGIACGLNNLQKIRDGEPLGGKASAESDFASDEGQVQVNHNHFLGYTKDADGNLIIDPEQAEVVKRIYREYLEGYSMDRIAKGLEADGILTGAGKTKWWTSTINKILRNEKYIGDALLQKTYTTDFLNKTRVKNNGIVPQYYVEGNHEAIIPKDIFLRVQEELVRKRVVKTSTNGKKRSYSCNHCFAQIVICGECGEMFRRIHWNNRGCKSIVWRCISRLEPTGQECHARTVNEPVLENVVVQAINTLLGDKSTYQTQLQQNIAKVIRSAQQKTADGIDERLQKLQKELLKKANNKEAYDEIADEIFKLREQREKCTVDTAARDAQISRINELQDFIKQQPTHLETFDEALVKHWLERIIVCEDHFTVELKSGLKIDIEG